MAQDPRYISGIYNYCDRCCERCAFTSRCLTYAMDRDDADSDARDLSNKAFWEKLQSVFEMTVEMLQELTEEEGVDPGAVDVMSATDDFHRRRERSKDHVLSLYARDYSEMVEDWFESGDESPVDALEIKDATEVIRWYQHQIYVKLARALAGEDQMSDDLQSDSDGSVLVALLAVDRSIGAWGELYRLFPDRVASVLDILVCLDRIRKITERFFPRARTFKRPGFDELN